MTMKLELVDDVEAIARRWSVRLAKVGAALSLGWAGLQVAGLVDKVPGWVSQIIAGIVFGGIASVAYFKQPEIEERKAASEMERREP
jgi:hypothetical protein